MVLAYIVYYICFISTISSSLVISIGTGTVYKHYIKINSGKSVYNIINDLRQ